MFLGAWEGHHRSLVKAISWRVAGSLDTLMLSYLVTRNFVFAGSIASAETVTKIVLYYVHERAWTVVLWGKRPRQAGLPETRFHWRGRVAHGAAAVVNFASPLRPLFDPVKLGIAASFILCFAIVVTPHRFVRPAPLSGLSPAGHLDGDPTNLAQFAPAMAEPGVPEPVREAPVPAPEQAQLARAGTDALPQPVAENLPVDAPKHNLLDREQARAVQRRLAELGYLSVSATGVWGPRSRNALRAFKSDHELAADENWDQATERSLFSGTLEPAQPFIGIWGADASACSSRLNRKGLLPAVIDGEGAWAGETFCTFESKKRITGGWNVVANCSNAHDRWIANVHLMINGNLLTWTSERGSQNYQRCQPGFGVARAF